MTYAPPAPPTPQPPPPTPQPTPLTPAERRRKRAKRLAIGAAALALSSVLGSFIPGKGEMVKAAILGAAVFADPDDAEAIEAWVDRTSTSFGPTGQWSTSDWAAAARHRLDATIAAKREQERAEARREEVETFTGTSVELPQALPTVLASPSPSEVTDSQRAALAESQAALDEIRRRNAESVEKQWGAACAGDVVAPPDSSQYAGPEDPMCVAYFARHPEIARPN